MYISVALCFKVLVSKGASQPPAVLLLLSGSGVRDLFPVITKLTAKGCVTDRMPIVYSHTQVANNTCSLHSDTGG